MEPIREEDPLFTPVHEVVAMRSFFVQSRRFSWPCICRGPRRRWEVGVEVMYECMRCGSVVTLRDVLGGGE